MKLIFESLNDNSISSLELATISESFKDNLEKGKKWVVEQINKFIKFIKEFINKYIRKAPKDKTIESLDISKLKRPSEILDKLGDNPTEIIKSKEAMVRHILKECVNYAFDDNLKVRENLIKGFGMKQLTMKEIEANIKLLESHLVDIKAMTEKKFSYNHAVTGQCLLPVYNTLLSIVTESFKNDSGKSKNQDVENTVEEARHDIINQYRFGMYSDGDSKLSLYSKKFSDLYQDDNGENDYIIKDKSKWSDDYKATLLVKTRKNFSKEKVNHLSTVTKYLSDKEKGKNKKGSDWGEIL